MVGAMELSNTLWLGIITASAILLVGKAGSLALLPVAAVPLVLLAVKATQQPRKGGAEAASDPGPSKGAGGVALPLDASQWKLPALHVADADMELFEEIVNNCFQVKHGIFCGESGGAPVHGWPKGDFPRALAQLRPMAARLPKGRPGIHEPVDDIMLAQRLIATDLNVEGACKLIKEYLEYREEMQGGVPPTLSWVESGVAFVPCEDRLGRPVVVVRPRLHKPGDVPGFIRGLRASVDAMTVHMLKKRRPGIRQGANLLEQYVLVFDFEGATWSNFDLDCLKATIHSGTHHYPNKIGQLFVLHINWFTSMAWNIAQKLLHPRTRRKCQLIPSHEVSAAMRKLIRDELLPPEYGGTGESWPRTPADARCFEEQVGELAAPVYRLAGAAPAGAKPSRIEAGIEKPHPDDVEHLELDSPASSHNCGLTSLGSCCTGRSARRSSDADAG